MIEDERDLTKSMFQHVVVGMLFMVLLLICGFLISAIIFYGVDEILRYFFG